MPHPQIFMTWETFLVMFSKTGFLPSFQIFALFARIKLVLSGIKHVIRACFIPKLSRLGKLSSSCSQKVAFCPHFRSSYSLRGSRSFQGGSSMLLKPASSPDFHNLRSVPCYFSSNLPFYPTSTLSIAPAYVFYLPR